MFYSACLTHVLRTVNVCCTFCCVNKYIENSLKFLKHINLLYKQSPTYKHGKYTKNANNALNRIKIYRNCIKFAKMTKSKKMSKTCQKFDVRMEPKIATRLCIWFVAVAFRSGERVS